MTSLRHPRTLFRLTALLLAGALSACDGQPPADSPESAVNDTGAEFAERLDAAVASATKHERFSGGALLARDGEVLLEKGYGYRDWSDPTTAVTPDAPFNIGSIGKMFTQVLVLEKVRQGQWSLEDTVEDLWPDSGIPNAGEMTIAHLLSHQSGLGNYFGHPDYGMAQRKQAEFLDLVRTQELAFEPPGTGVYYSNSAFWVLAELLSRTEKEPRDWYRRVQQDVFDRAGMDEVYPFQPDEAAPRRPLGHFTNVVGERREVGPDQDPRPGPDGGLYATPRALFQFAEAVRSGEWYGTDLMDRGRKTVGELGMHGCRFGLTWEICPVGDTQLTTKGGTTMGGGAEFVLFRHDGHDYTLVLLSNFSNAPLELLPELVGYMIGHPGAGLPGRRPSVVLHEAIEAGQLATIEADFPAWLKSNNLKGDPIFVYLLARHYEKHGKPDTARTLYALNTKHFDGHPPSARRLK